MHAIELGHTDRRAIAQGITLVLSASIGIMTMSGHVYLQTTLFSDLAMMF